MSKFAVNFVKKHVTPDSIPLLTACAFGLCFAGVRMYQMAVSDEAALFQSNKIPSLEKRMGELEKLDSGRFGGLLSSSAGEGGDSGDQGSKEGGGHH